MAEEKNPNNTEAEEAVTPEATAETGSEASADDTTTETETEETVAEEITKEEAGTQLTPGMVVRVHLKIKDITPKGEERERIQIFEGMIIAKKGQDASVATITVRKESGGFGVERIFPLAMPTIDKIEVVKRYKVRQSKLYYLRGGKKRKLKETKDNDSRK